MGKLGENLLVGLALICIAIVVVIITIYLTSAFGDVMEGFHRFVQSVKLTIS